MDIIFSLQIGVFGIFLITSTIHRKKQTSIVRNGAGSLFRITPACENCGIRVHRVVACCRGIKLLLIRRSRLAFFARLRRFCVCLGYIGATLYG